MSSTSKARLAEAKDMLDRAFHNAHSADVPEMVKELREYLTLKNSAVKNPQYGNHRNAATGAN